MRAVSSGINRQPLEGYRAGCILPVSHRKNPDGLLTWQCQYVGPRIDIDRLASIAISIISVVVRTTFHRCNKPTFPGFLAALGSGTHTSRVLGDGKLSFACAGGLQPRRLTHEVAVVREGMELEVDSVGGKGLA
jgi:hypothetical protein